MPEDKITDALTAQGVAAQIKKAGEATKTQIAANKATAGESTDTPVYNAAADIAAVTAPVNDAVSFEDRLRARFAKEYELEKEKEARRLRGQRLGQDIGSLAASIGDVIRAHEGAPVSLRDWQRIYDNLTAQEKANTDNYRVRMQKLRDDARADRMAQAQADSSARAAQQQREYDHYKWLESLSEAEKERILKYYLHEDTQKFKEQENKKYRDMQERLEGIRQQGKSNQYHNKLLSSSDTLVFNGVTYYFPKESFKKVASDITGMLSRQHNITTKYFQDFNGFKSMNEVEQKLREWLQSDEAKDEAVRAGVEKILKAYDIDQKSSVMNEFDAAQQYYVTPAGENTPSGF